MQYCEKRFINFGYSRLYKARKTEAGAQPPGLTLEDKEKKIKKIKNYISNNFLLVEQ